jgi:four helix bundle protein
MINHFSELIIWQKSKILYLKLYRLLENSKEFVLKDQLLRATLSISNNIAEGYGRGGKREFLYFLKIAHGSCYEVESMLYIMSDLSKIDKETESEIRSELVDIYNKISAMMNGIKKKIDAEAITKRK